MNRHTFVTFTAERASPWSLVVWLGRRVMVPVAIIIALVAWALALPQPAPRMPPGAGIVLTVITLGMAVLTQMVRRRLDERGGASVTLPDPLYILYLAAFILAGAAIALPLAALTPFVAAAAGLLWQRERVPARRERVWERGRDWERVTRPFTTALSESATATATTFAAGVVYIHVTPVVAHALGELRAEVVAALLAAVVVFVAVLVAHALERAALGVPLAGSLARAMLSPSMRFQALLLSIGPLLPLANLLDDIEAEFAWILFLIPLGVVYYLALVSVRLEQRTDELQKTIGELGQSRRREAELTGYAALITRAQEDERRRLARELHDDTAQALIALSRGLDALSTHQAKTPLSSRDAHFIRELTELAARTLESVRRACQDLRPSVLDDLGLSAALESLAEATSRQGLPCVFSEDGEPATYAPELEVTVYRIAQEALSNARRHSGAGSAAIHIVYGDDALDLQVSDNGSGFDVERMLRATEGGEAAVETDAARQGRGLGLLGMRERAALIGARLRVGAAEVGGTRVSLHVPLHVGGGEVRGESAAPAAPR